MPAAPAYLILSYTLPELVRRLVETLRAQSPHAVIVVHHDDRRSTLGRVDALRVEPPSAIEWGHGSQLAAVLRCLRFLRERTEFGWVTLLSGQDHPLRPLAHIEAELAATEADAFVDAAPVAPLRWRRSQVDEFARRYRYRWRPVRPAVARLAARAHPLVQVRTLPPGTFAGLPARPPLPPFHGSDWSTLSRRAVDVLLGAPAAVVDHYLHTLVPTEGFAATVLANAPGVRLVRDNRRFAAFEGPDSAHPRVLGLADLDAALASGGDFARKFDSLAVLDALDARLSRAPR